MADSWKNQLYFGDNLDILKQLHSEYPQGFIDLIYIDPPFNSKRNYNVLFESIDLKDSTAQKEAFADTWTNVSYMDMLNELSDLDISLYNFLKNLDNTNISKGAISYLTTMAIRLWYMHKLLKDTGSFYLHCDPTMSHYLKIICDLVFGEKNFRSEISWKRTSAHNNAKQGRAIFESVRDIILFYTRGEKWVWNQQYLSYNEAYIASSYRMVEPNTGRRFSAENLTAAKGGGDTSYEWKGYKLKSGRFWAYSKANMEKFEKENKLYYTRSGLPRLINYLDEMPGKVIDNNWEDIQPAKSNERLGYPTQKPEALLERIIKTSSNEGDLIADFFCGCGTAITVAEKLKRHWIGVDISHLAVKLITKRLGDAYGDDILKTFEIHGFPKDIDSARELANNVKGGRLEFEDWIIEVLLLGITNKRRNEMGYDGYRTFSIYDKKYIVMMEVKSGNASPTQLNHFIMTIGDKKGAMGVFICFSEQITRNMQVIAKKEGQFVDDYGNSYCNKIQLISVEDLLEGKRPQIPASKFETFKKAEKKSTDTDTQVKLEL